MNALRFSVMLSDIRSSLWEKVPPNMFLEAVQEWETQINDYQTQSGEHISSAIKLSVIIRWTPSPIKEVLRGHSPQIGTDFVALRTILQAYVTSGQEFDPSGIRKADDGGTRPMDVGACARCGGNHETSKCYANLDKKDKGKGDKDGKGGKSQQYGGGKTTYGGKGDKGGKYGKGYGGGGKNPGGKPGHGHGGKSQGQEQHKVQNPAYEYFEGNCGYCGRGATSGRPAANDNESDSKDEQQQFRHHRRVRS